MSPKHWRISLGGVSTKRAWRLPGVTILVGQACETESAALALAKLWFIEHRSESSLTVLAGRMRDPQLKPAAKLQYSSSTPATLTEVQSRTAGNAVLAPSVFEARGSLVHGWWASKKAGAGLVCSLQGLEPDQQPRTGGVGGDSCVVGGGDVEASSRSRRCEL
jgi:hypothetical protein